MTDKRRWLDICTVIMIGVLLSSPAIAVDSVLGWSGSVESVAGHSCLIGENSDRYRPGCARMSLGDSAVYASLGGIDAGSGYVISFYARSASNVVVKTDIEGIDASIRIHDISNAWKKYSYKMHVEGAIDDAKLRFYSSSGAAVFVDGVEMQKIGSANVLYDNSGVCGCEYPFISMVYGECGVADTGMIDDYYVMQSVRREKLDACSYISESNNQDSDMCYDVYAATVSRSAAVAFGRDDETADEIQSVCDNIQDESSRLACEYRVHSFYYDIMPECGDREINSLSEECEVGDIGKCDDEGYAPSGECIEDRCLCYTYCGDGVVQLQNSDGVAEECDGGDRCTEDCRLETFCGDRTKQWPNDDSEFEYCDDGNDDESDLCTNDCELTKCGDEIVQYPNGRGDYEECDTTSEECAWNEVCNLDCECSLCGNDEINEDEVCDDGNFAWDSGICAPDCSVRNRYSTREEDDEYKLRTMAWYDHPQRGYELRGHYWIINDEASLTHFCTERGFDRALPCSFVWEEELTEETYFAHYDTRWKAIGYDDGETVELCFILHCKND